MICFVFEIFNFFPPTVYKIDIKWCSRNRWNQEVKHTVWMVRSWILRFCLYLTLPLSSNVISEKVLGISAELMHAFKSFALIKISCIQRPTVPENINKVTITQQHRKANTNDIFERFPNPNCRFRGTTS